jgi:hypothetical protein
VLRGRRVTVGGRSSLRNDIEAKCGATRWFITLWLISALTVRLATASPPVSAAAVFVPAPYVSPLVSSFPGRSFEETVMTLSAEPVQVAVARIPDANVADADAPGPRGPYNGVNPQYPTVFRAGVDYDHRTGGGFEHRIEIPPQRPGLYEIVLASRERTALQQFAVGTLGAVADFESSDSALLPIDTRTMRRRSDVSLAGYTNTQRRVFRPGPDGLIHLSDDFTGTNLPNWPLGKLILTSSDGSILPLNYLQVVPPGDRTYFDTDRGAYREGDRVHYELITRRPARNKEAVLSLFGQGANVTESIVLNGRITTGGVTLPSDVASGVYRFGLDGGLTALSITDTRASKYEIDLRAATPRVAMGMLVKFLVSVRTLRGRPASGVRVPYAWHFSQYIRGPIPIAASLSMDRDLKRAETVTDADGDATITIQTPSDRAAPVELVADDPDTNVLMATALAQTFAPIPNAADSLVSVSPPVISMQGDSVSVNARGGADGDAILRYGSSPDFRWRVVSFERNVARLSISPPSDEDLVPVSIMTASDSESIPPEQLVVARPGEPHRLRVTLGCYQPDNDRGQSIHLCARIRNSRNRPARSNITVAISEATEADVAAAKGSSDAPYHDLYDSPVEMGRLYSSVKSWKATPPISYLYPEPPRARPRAFVYHFGSARESVTVAGPESRLPPQTPYWLDQVASDKNGVLVMQLPWSIAARSTLYVIRVTAVTSRGEVGQAFVFVRHRDPV